MAAAFVKVHGAKEGRLATWLVEDDVKLQKRNLTYKLSAQGRTRQREEAVWDWTGAPPRFGRSVGGPRESGNGVEWNGLERRSEEAKAVRSGGPRSAEPRNRRVLSEQWSEAGVMIPGFTLFWLPSPPTYLWMYEPVYHKPLHELTRVLIPVEPVVCPAAFLTFRAADMEAR